MINLKFFDEDIEGLRGLYDKKLNSEIEVQQNMHKKQLEKAKRKAKRKKSKD